MEIVLYFGFLLTLYCGNFLFNIQIYTNKYIYIYTYINTKQRLQENILKYC